MIKLDDLASKGRKHPGQPRTVVVRDTDFDLQPLIKPGAADPGERLRQELVTERPLRMNSAIQPLHHQVIGAQTRHAALSEMKSRTAPKSVASPLVRAAEMKMCQINVLSLQSLRQHPRGLATRSFFVPCKMMADQTLKFGRDLVPIP